jgi:hypothetical protein
LRYTLSEPARVVFKIEQAVRGRRAGRACRKPTRANRRKLACTRFQRVGAFAQSGHAGANTKPFSGKLGRRVLTPGDYRLTLIARDAAGNVSQPKRLTFRVVRR